MSILYITSEILYNKKQGSRKMKKIIKFIESVIIFICLSVVYAIFLRLIWYILSILPDKKLWSSLSNFYKINIFNHVYDSFDIIYLILGFPLFVYGGYNLVQISKMISKAHDRKTRTPIKLLKDKYYRKVRHPMYAMFMFINLGLFFSLRSTFGIFIPFIMIPSFAFNGWMEEKKILIPKFEDEYKEYAKKVRSRYFTKVTGGYVTLLLILSVLGLIF